MADIRKFAEIMEAQVRADLRRNIRVWIFNNSRNPSEDRDSIYTKLVRYDMKFLLDFVVDSSKYDESKITLDSKTAKTLTGMPLYELEMLADAFGLDASKIRNKAVGRVTETLLFDYS